MDYRLMRRTIILCVTMMAVVFGVLVLVNWNTISRRFGAQPGAQPKEDVADTAAAQKVKGKETFFGTQIGDRLGAFQYDETFFDPVLTAAERLLLERSSNKLSLIGTSVEQDLHIKVADSHGDPVKGYTFVVTLTKGGQDDPLGDYKDLDQDGILYVGGLAPGDYYMSLSPMKGFDISDVPIRIMVKERVEYVVIDNSSLVLYAQSDIDLEQEDTRVNGAEETADDTEFTRFRTDNGHMGIDVSTYQNEIDWYKVKQAGVEFAIIRCGFRGSKSGYLVEDAYFSRNMAGAAAAGIPVGVYFFTQAINEVEAVEEASIVVSLCERYDVKLPIYIDTEGAGGNGRADGLDVAARTAVCQAFCATVQNAGYRAGVYASKYWLEHNIDAKKLDKYEIWLAQYSSRPTYGEYYSMWQYSSKGQVDGIEGNVDLDQGYFDLP